MMCRRGLLSTVAGLPLMALAQIAGRAAKVLPASGMLAPNTLSGAYWQQYLLSDGLPLKSPPFRAVYREVITDLDAVRALQQVRADAILASIPEAIETSAAQQLATMQRSFAEAVRARAELVAEIRAGTLSAEVPREGAPTPSPALSFPDVSPMHERLVGHFEPVLEQAS